MTKRRQQKNGKRIPAILMAAAPFQLSGNNPELVKAAIRLRGQTLSSLSRQHGYCPAYLRNALRRPLFRGEQIIASFLGMDACKIWPDRYGADGKPDYAKWRLLHPSKLKRRAA